MHMHSTLFNGVCSPSCQIRKLTPPSESVRLSSVVLSKSMSAAALMMASDHICVGKKRSAINELQSAIPLESGCV